MNQLPTPLAAASSRTGEPATCTPANFDPEVFCTFRRDDSGLHVLYNPDTTTDQQALDLVLALRADARGGTCSTGGTFITASLPDHEHPFEIVKITDSLTHMTLDDTRMSIETAYGVLDLAEKRAEQDTPPCTALEGTCLGIECSNQDTHPDNRVHHARAEAMNGPYGNRLMEFHLTQWPGDKPCLVFYSESDWPELDLDGLDQLITDMDAHLGKLRAARATLARLTSKGDRP